MLFTFQLIQIPFYNTFEFSKHVKTCLVACVYTCLSLTVYLFFYPKKGKLVKQQRLNYFRNKWNLLELSIIFLSWSAVAIFIKRTLIGNRDMTYYQNNKEQ